MKRSDSGRLAALTGVAFFVLGIVGTLATPGGEPAFVGEPTAIASYYTENADGILASSALYAVATAFLLWFAGYLRTVLQRAEGGDGRLATTAFGAAAAGSALLLAATATSAVGALRVQEQDAIGPEVATAIWDSSTILYGLAAPMAMAVLVLATAAVALRTRALPVWLGGLSVVLGIALAIPPISYVAIIVFNFWVLATALVLVLRPEPAASAATGVRQEAAAGA